MNDTDRCPSLSVAPTWPVPAPDCNEQHDTIPMRPGCPTEVLVRNNDVVDTLMPIIPKSARVPAFAAEYLSLVEGAA